MPKILKFFTYFLSSLLTFLFLIVLATENTNIVSNLYKEKIVEYIQSESQLRFNFDSLDVKWNGIYPNLIFNKISLYKLNEEESYLNGNKLIINIDAIESLSDFKFKILGLNLVESKISLTYDNNGLFLKGYNLLHNKKLPAMVMALKADITARGLCDKINPAVKLIDYDSFVELTLQHKHTIIW